MPHIAGMLQESHRTVDRLLGAVVVSEDADERAVHFRKLKKALRTELTFKEQKLYPIVARSDGTAAFIVKVALGDHFEINLMIDRLEHMDMQSGAFDDLVLDLEEALDAHICREKEEILPFLHWQPLGDESRRDNPKVKEIM